MFPGDPEHAERFGVGDRCERARRREAGVRGAQRGSAHRLDGRVSVCFCLLSVLGRARGRTVTQTCYCHAPPRSPPPSPLRGAPPLPPLLIIRLASLLTSSLFSFSTSFIFPYPSYMLSHCFWTHNHIISQIFPSPTVVLNGSFALSLSIIPVRLKGW